ncbi:hypothetical protein [Streptomyces sp. SP18CS02]|uniref:hypothetical protein n=1 Tax=Streptomyces sp. SP18CS02 TaxID=3002531 RepID=UPI002E7A6C6F|nr:hypothetical protein [Streptomyces sp. SP18CS02]MEE1752342.1 hypothetical protein [Streptomyces sp. SP18CS02]
MRPSNVLAAGVAAAVLAPLPFTAPAAALTRPGSDGAVAVPERQPVCGDASAAGFPLTTRIRGGPETYRPGGGPGSWYVELTNTTTEACRNIHPVLVLTDRDRTLAPAQLLLEFQQKEGDGVLRPVTVEKTDRNELVAVLDDGLPGFTVLPGRTVTVPVRLAFTADARSNEVTARAAVVQRQGDDGDWVGESDDYRFALAGGKSPDGPSTGTGPSDGPSGGPSTGPSAGASPEASGPASPNPSGDVRASAAPSAGRSAEPSAEELPKTGRHSLFMAGVSALALVLGAGTLLLAGRLRRGRGGRG